MMGKSKGGGGGGGDDGDVLACRINELISRTEYIG